MSRGALGNFKEELHASSDFAMRPARTPFFYQTMAKRYASWLVDWGWEQGDRATAAALAKHYRESYRESKALWQKAFGLSAGGAK